MLTLGGRRAALAPLSRRLKLTRTRRKSGRAGFVRWTMLLRPLRSWGLQTLRRRQGPGSPASGLGTRGSQRRTWPRGNASLHPTSLAAG